MRFDLESFKIVRQSCPVCIIILFAVIVNAYSQDRTSTNPIYRMPPQSIIDLVDAPPTPSVSIDPTGKWLLLMERASLPSIAELSQPELRIGGLRINPDTNGRSRTRPFVGLSLVNISDGAHRKIEGLDDTALIENVSWSPDGMKLAFTITTEDHIQLWAADVGRARARRLTNHALNAAYRTPYQWLSDSRTLVCKVVMSDRGTIPVKQSVPEGPIIQENIGKTAPARTYQDLLQDEHDAQLLEYYLSSNLRLISLDGTSQDLDHSGLVSRINPSPDGRYIMVTTIHRPFSYLVPVYRFPSRVDIIDLQGKRIKTLAELPLAEEIPIGRGSAPTGPRSFGWRSDAPASVYWVEAQDGGDPHAKAEIRDKVYLFDSPFSGSPVTMISLPLRFSGITWANDHLALVNEWWWSNRKFRTWMIDPQSPEQDPIVLLDYSYEDRYNHPGSPLTTRNSMGESVLLTDDNGSSIFLTGSGASAEGDRPFFDRMDLSSRETTRIWRSEAPYYEWPVAVTDLENLKLITRRETESEPPNYYIRSLKHNDMRQLTQFPHPAPQLMGVQKELVTYDREDGVALSATLYLPPGYSPQDGPLPMVMWAYPREYKSAAAASQVTGSPYRFVRISNSSPLLFLTQGYAILDGPTMPIVGEGEAEPNDTFVEQLVTSAKAAIDEMVRRGVADRDRIAISGHSYGAFMTANLLAHSDLFSAGIARSGAYNRTFTPFGFQSEERTFWQAPEIYFRMSPFMHADKINEPILLIHGQLDNNSGTFPIQSERFYNALKGHGATARLVMLPFESHGYRARESVMHVWWEMTEWLDKYVKNAPLKKATIGSN